MNVLSLKKLWNHLHNHIPSLLGVSANLLELYLDYICRKNLESGLFNSKLKIGAQVARTDTRVRKPSQISENKFCEISYPFVINFFSYFFTQKLQTALLLTLCQSTVSAKLKSQKIFLLQTLLRIINGKLNSQVYN